MFIDEVRITVTSGNGGKGCVSFRREKFVPHGGPDGGDGGDGADVVFTVDPNANTLLKFTYNRSFKAPNGRPGQGANKSGQSGEDLIITVPLGTIIRDEDTGEIVADLSDPADRVVAAEGGRGGRGNTRFATPTHQSPRDFDPGHDGQERHLQLELKLLADVGLVGFPNAGKSTFLSTVSSAHPKIADYPFTTLQPNLGIVSYGDMKTLVMADIPGIIEGAHEGKGLGLRFLKHIERTRVLLIMIPCTSEDPEAEYRTLIDELALFSPKLVEKPRMVAFTQMDLASVDEPPAIPVFEKGVDVAAISSATGSGVRDLVFRLGKLVEAAARL